MKKLLLKIALFAALLSAPYAPPFVALLFSGELTPVSKVVEEQMTGKRQVYYACVYSDPRMLFKLKSAQARKPEVLIMGTSRVGQIRKEFFLPNVNFYNASMATEVIGDYRTFLEHLPPADLPKLVIAGLDQRYFNPNDKPMGSFSINTAKASSPWRVPLLVADQWRKIYSDYKNKKFSVGAVWKQSTKDKKLVGLRAVMLGDGFRNDGSYYYCQNVTQGLHNMQEGLLRIDHAGHFFDHGQEVSQASLDELDRLASFCEKHQINFVAFLPPYSHAAYERLMANGNFGYISKLPALARPIVERHGFKLEDFTDLGTLGIPDTQSFDVYHPTETGSLRVFLALAKSDPGLQRYCDVAGLESLLANNRSDFCVFKD